MVGFVSIVKKLLVQIIIWHRVKNWLHYKKKRYSLSKNREFYCLIYSEGVGDVNIIQLITFHKTQNVKATLTAVLPPGRFGALDIKANKVDKFSEKPEGSGATINGGFFVLSPKVIGYITEDKIIWEREPLEHLAEGAELAAFLHYGFGQCVGMLRDKIALEELWRTGKAPWKAWRWQSISGLVNAYF